jgi:hypothetical protein
MISYELDNVVGCWTASSQASYSFYVSELIISIPETELNPKSLFQASVQRLQSAPFHRPKLAVIPAPFHLKTEA